MPTINSAHVLCIEVSLLKELTVTMFGLKDKKEDSEMRKTKREEERKEN